MKPGQAHKVAGRVRATLYHVVYIGLHWQPAVARNVELDPDVVKIGLKGNTTPIGIGGTFVASYSTAGNAVEPSQRQQNADIFSARANAAIEGNIWRVDVGLNTVGHAIVDVVANF